jgi:excisionase family DNA binding protein
MEFMTTREVCDLARVSANTLTRWAREGRMPAPVQPSSRKRLWPQREIRQWLENAPELRVVEVAND